MQEDAREGNHVLGNFEELGNRGELRDRDNAVDGHASLFGNTPAMPPADDIDLLHNAVARHLTCQGNVPAPHQEGTHRDRSGRRRGSVPHPPKSPYKIATHPTRG